MTDKCHGKTIRSNKRRNEIRKREGTRGKERRKQGRKEGREEGRKDGRKDGRTKEMVDEVRRGIIIMLWGHLRKSPRVHREKTPATV